MTEALEMTPAAIRAARKSLGLTQAQLADVLRLGSNRRISEYERGTIEPSAPVAELLRAYLAGYRCADWPK